MMERLLLQVLERKKWIVDQAKHQTRLFDQHLASTLLIDGIDSPEWLIRPQPSAAEFKREELIRGLLQRPLQSEILDPICCFSENEEALDQENNEKYQVDLGNDLQSMIETCNGCDKLSVFPDGMTKGSLDAESGPRRADYSNFSPSTKHKGETSGIHHDLELSLARLQRSRIRQRALEIRSGAKATRSSSRYVKTENSEDNKIATRGIACQTKFSTPSHKKCQTDAQPVNAPGSYLPNKRGENSEGDGLATSGIVCQTNMQHVEFSTSSKCSADVRLTHTEETWEVPIISIEGNRISEMSGQRKIYVYGPEVHNSLRDSGEAMALARSFSRSDCLKEYLGKASSFRAQVEETIEGNLGDSCDDEVRSINCSKNDLRCQRTTSVGGVDVVIKIDGSSNGMKGKNGHELKLMHQSTPLDHLQEADERCRVDRAGNEICQNGQHESVSESLMESRNNDKIMEMDGSTKIGELLIEGSSGQLSKESKPVEGSSDQLSKESKPLVYWGCWSLESGCVPSSQHVSKSAADLLNTCGCDTDREGFVDDSAGGVLPSRNLAQINCSKKVLRSQSSTPAGDDVIKFEDSSNEKKGKTGHELIHQSAPSDNLPEADEICMPGNDVCQNTQHESACKSLTESRRMSCISYNDKIMEMDCSTEIGELFVEGSSGQLSKESKPLVHWGFRSIESRCVPFSQHVSKSAANLQNTCGCDTDQEGYVDDSAGGFLPCRHLAEVNCSKKVLRSQSSTPAGDVDDVIKFEGSSNGKKGQTGHELMHQSTPLDHLLEADEICEVDRSRNEVSQNGQHDNASEMLTASSRISYISDNKMISEMDCSTKIGKLSVEGSSGQVSKESKPLVYWGCRSVESGYVTTSQHFSKSADKLQNRHGCDTEQVGYVDDSAEGFCRSRNLAEVVSLVKLKRDADEFVNDTEVLVPGSISHVNMNLESKELILNTLGRNVVDLDVDSAIIPQEAIRRSRLLRQASLRQWNDKNERKPCEVSFEDHISETTQLDTLPRQTVESSDPTDFVEQHSVPDSNGGASSHPAIGLSSNRCEEGKTTNPGEQEETRGEEQRQPYCVCLEDRHEADAEPVLRENPVLAHHMFCSSSSQFSNSVAEDQNDILAEGFVMAKHNDHSCSSEDKCSFKTQAGENAAEQNKRILELLSKSTWLNTPVQEYFMGNTNNQLSRLYQSVPNGLLEHVDLGSSLAMNDGKQGGNAFEGRSYSDCLPYCEAASTRYNRKPYSSPVGKLWESICSNSGSSKQEHSLITELPSIIEEIELADEAADGLNEGNSVEMANARREPLVEISDDPNIPISDQDEEIARLILGSTMTEAPLPASNRNHKYQENKKRDLTGKDKGSKTFERGPNGANWAIESPKIKLARPITSLKNGGGGPSISGKESKLHNIVSNITSFLPLIQQKQAVAPAAGKRNVKVKALEAAEAAKRQAEKKEVERKVKKEALKSERERIEKENMRRLELEQKRKYEERKKRQADMALKKRQMENKEKREKEKKRKRVEEPHRNQAGRYKVSCAGKERPKAKDLDTDAVMTEKLSVDSGEQFRDNGDTAGNLNDLSETILSSMGREEETGNPEPSYDISPYKCSDDEDEEEDDIPNDKFMPSWARKGSIVQYVFRQQRLDPNVIFPPDSFCGISEVIRPLKHQLK
ncbi:hypothetical protein MLD38_035070 [Melastoma candidum]|uniref:Uncharacterized protein n=1 Tax=Melastoma candidum TaxID=119954 RepID=A0ACB9MDS8_9MYRT|nr:hypothetical protein MLD38_035070 [Melastoma candidum]